MGSTEAGPHLREGVQHREVGVQDLRLTLGKIGSGNIRAQGDGATVGVQDASEQLQQSGFAGAIFADQGNFRAAFDVKRQAVIDDQIAVALFHIAGFEADGPGPRRLGKPKLH